MKRTWLVSIIVLALVIVGIVFYLARPRTDETDNIAVHPYSPPAAQPATAPTGAPSALVSCTGPMSSQIPVADLVARHKWVHSLMMANHFDSALTELHNIATVDPGYPAINLDIADALLKAKRPNEAKDAINLQLEISECLANLPQPEVQTYCKSEWVTEPNGGCSAELARINQQAHYEAGRVDAELSRSSQPHPTPTPAAPVATAAVAQPKPKIVAPLRMSAPATGTTGQEVAAVKTPAEPPATAAAATPAAAPPGPPINIKAGEASDHVGQLARVCGVVASKHTAEESNGKPTFINLERSFPNPAFTVLIWGADATAVGELPSAGNLCVTGTVVSYRGTPEIVLHDAKSWSQ